MGFTMKQAKLSIENIQYLNAEQAIQWILMNPDVGLSPDKSSPSPFKTQIEA